MELYSLITEAHTLWEHGDSEFICDCLNQVMDQRTGEYRVYYDEIDSLLQFIKSEIQGAFSVKTFLYPGIIFLDKEQAEHVREFREQLWQKLWDMTA